MPIEGRNFSLIFVANRFPATDTIIIIIPIAMAEIAILGADILLYSL
jgi:hypothetical protein